MKLKRWVRQTILLASVSLILHDFYKIGVEPIITGYTTSFTWLGIVTLGIAFGLAEWSYDSLKGGK